MGIDDITGKAGEAVDAVADQVKNVAPEQTHGVVDQAADAAKGLLDKATGGSAEA